MIEEEEKPVRTNGDAHRESLLSQLSQLSDRLRSDSNRQMKFADVPADFPGLSRILFCGRDLRRTDLRDADLRGIDFGGSDLSGCDFSNSLIVGARFDGAKVSRHALMRADDWSSYRANWAPNTDSEGADVTAPGFHRDPGERFSFSPLLPELVILSESFVSEPPKINPNEQRALDGGRLAIALSGLTNREIVQVVASDRLAEADESTTVRPAYAARSYCWELTRRATEFGLPRKTLVRLPSYELFHAIAARATDRPKHSGRPLDTDLGPADLRLGAYGQEFVWAGDDDELAIATTGPFLDLHDYPKHPLSAGEKSALVRPVFLLGGI